MTSKCRCRSLMTDAFEDVALALGGVVASYDVPDEAIWDLARAIDLTHERAQARFSRTEEEATSIETPKADYQHPAVSHLLTRLRANGPK